MLDGSFTELMGQEGQADYGRERLLKHDSQQIRGREGKESVLGIDNSSQTVQKRAGMFRYDEWSHFSFEKIDASSFGGWIHTLKFLSVCLFV